MSIDKKYKDRITKMSTKLGLEISDLEKKYLDYLSKEDSKRIAWNKFYGEILREEGTLYGNTEVFLGYLCGDSGRSDIIEGMIDKANRWYRDPETRALAISRHMTDERGIPLDYRLTLFGKDNPNYGSPLEGHAYNRTIYAITGKYPDFTEPMVTAIGFRNDLAKNMDNTGLQTFCKFRATVYNKEKSEIRNLNAVKSTKFKDFDVEYEPYELINKIPAVYTINEIARLWSTKFRDEKTNGNKKFSETEPVIIEAFVGDITIGSDNKNNSFMLRDAEEDEVETDSVRCFMSPLNKVSFIRDSIVYFLGRVRKGSYRGKEQYTINADGYIPSKDTVYEG